MTRRREADSEARELEERRAAVERELARLRASLGHETGGGWKGRSLSLLLVAGAVGVALGAAVFRRRRLPGRSD